MSAGRLIVGGLLAVAVTAAFGWGSRAPYTAHPREDALLRLSWRSAGQRVEECRTPSPEELDRLPPHMRQERICEGRIVPFRLFVEVDGEVVVDEVIHAAGVREDRPIFVYREIPVDPGEHELRLRFAPEASVALPSGEPAMMLELDRRIRLEPRQIVLVTQTADGRSLTAVDRETR